MQHQQTISPITPARAQKILADNGLNTTLEEAAGILQFLIKLATLTQHENSLSLYTGEHRRAS